MISFSFTDQELFSSICIQLIESSELFSSTWARFLLWETFSGFLCLCFCFDDVFVYTFSLFVFLLCLRFCWGDKWCHPLAWNGHRLRTFTQRCLWKVSLARKIVKNRKQKSTFYVSLDIPIQIFIQNFESNFKEIVEQNSQF